MTKFVAIAALALASCVASPVYAQDMAGDRIEVKHPMLCPHISEYSRSVMGAYQTGVSITKIMELAQKPDNAEAIPNMVRIVRRASYVPRYSSRAFRIRAEIDFASEIARECYAVAGR